MKTIKVFGHKAPDTDSICSAIIYAWYLNDLRNRPATPCRLGEINKETEFVLKEFGFKKPRLITSVEKNDRIAIVDTNNPNELIDLNDASVIEIIDHHKLYGGINTMDPINFTLRRTACTATVIYLKLRERGITSIPKKIAGLMLACMISDSLNFSSPTTTETDRKIAQRLARKYKFNINELAGKMFDAKSNINQYSPEELITWDSKVVKIKGRNIRISVIETNKIEKVIEKISKLQPAIKKVKEKEKLKEVLVFGVDIVGKEALLINEDEHSKNIIRKAFSIEKETKDGILLPGIISRKKQIVPALLS